MKDIPYRQSIRLSGYDYSQTGYYYITICTQNRAEIFGEIKNGKMILNDVGKIVDHRINEIPKKFPNTKIDIHQVMPNHIHIIIIIVGAGFSRPNKTSIKLPILGQIIAYFKYQTTIEINNINIESGAKTAPLQRHIKYKQFFQRNYYEHIVRNEINYFKIREYIKSNPKNWDQDKNNPNNL